MSKSPTLSPYLYMPMEIQGRELDSRALMACYALKAGFQIIIGQQWLMKANIPHLPPGTFVFKGANKVEAYSIGKVRSHGHRVVVIDEETLSLSDADNLVRCVHGDGLANIDILFTPGPFNSIANARAFPRHSDRLVCVGNPRLDLLRPQFRARYADEVAEIRRKYGDFILFNTNFGVGNSAWGSLQKLFQVMVNIGFVDPKKVEDHGWIKEYARFESNTLQAMKNALPDILDHFADTPIILRPHNSENFDTWKGVAGSKQELLLVTEGGANPWMLAAKALVHNSCTTGLEAAMLGTPAIAYCPVQSPILDYVVSNKLNTNCRTPEQLIGALEQAMALPVKPEGLSDAEKLTYEQYYSSLDGPTSAEKIIHFIKRMLDDAKVRDDAPEWQPGSGFIKEIPRDDYQRRKIDLTKETLDRTIAYMSGCVGLEMDYEISEIGESLFTVIPNGVRGTATADAKRLAPV